MAIQCRGYDQTRRNLWQGEFPSATPSVSWTKTGYEYGAPVYVSGDHVVTVTGTSGEDASRIASYSVAAGTLQWEVNLPAGQAVPAGHSWLIGVNDTYAICVRPSTTSTYTDIVIHGLALTNGAVAWSTNITLYFGPFEAFDDFSNSFIDASGNLHVTAVNTIYAKLTVAEVNGTTGSITWYDQIQNIRSSDAYNSGLAATADGRTIDMRGMQYDSSTNLVVPGWMYVLSSTNPGTLLGRYQYGYIIEGGVVVSTTTVTDTKFGPRVYAKYNLQFDGGSFYGGALRAHSLETNDPVLLWSADTHLNTTLGFFAITEHPTVDLFGNLYVNDGDCLVRQYRGVDGALLHTFPQIGTFGYNQNMVIADTTGKIIQVDRGGAFAMRMFDLASIAPYTPKWTITSALAGFTTSPCLYKDGLYINAGGSLKKYTVKLPSKRPPAEYAP